MHKNRHRNFKSSNDRSLPKNLNFWIKLQLSGGPKTFNDLAKILQDLCRTADSGEIQRKISYEIHNLLNVDEIFYDPQDKIVLGSKKYQNKYVECKISVSPAGFGYAIPVHDNTGMDKLFISKFFLKNSLHDDIASISYINQSVKGLEGVVVGIKTRNSLDQVLLITYRIDSNLYKGTSRLSPHATFHIRSTKQLQIGDIVKCTLSSNQQLDVTDENKDKSIILADFNESIGNIKDPRTDNIVAKLENNLSGEFSNEVKEEIKEIQKNRHNFLDQEDRKDFREQLVVTIDPETSKDFDDAISVIKLDDGTYKLYIHIADVTHYVKSGTAVDAVARERCNSTYLPSEVVPMLPFELADDLCSLVPNQDRPTSSLEIEIDSKGNTISYNVSKGIINSKLRLTYNDAKEIIEGTQQSIASEMLKNAFDLYKILHKKKISEGYVPVTTDEVKVILDENESPTGILVEEYDFSHSLIEVFMVKANETVSKFVAEKLNKASIFRVHEKPTAKNIELFVERLKEIGVHINPQPTGQDVNELLKKFKNTELSSMVSLDYIQHMNQAIYSTDNKGHFGLNLDFYSHFTSPIRRYADLLLHRLAFDNEEIDTSEISLVASNCSKKERISAKAEKQSTRLKKLRLLKMWSEKNSSKTYEAVVYKIFPSRIYTDILSLQLSCDIMLSSLTDGFYSWDSQARRLTSRSGKSISRGNVLSIEVVGVNLISNQIMTRVVSSRYAKVN
ncbi:MAG: VacB/RNase II family 3'-5' exoribonuclease [Chlamydiia bacterium]|nr:VacB/RNase II family 3'-5' exoribonuclease [Chlamydiia bacterium]